MNNKVVNRSIVKIREYLFYLLIFSLPWQTRWIIRDPSLGGEVWEYGRISLYGWDILLLVLAVISMPLLWQEIKNVKIKSQDVIPAKAGIQTKQQTEFLDSDSEAGMTNNVDNKRLVFGTLFYLYFGLLVLSFFSIYWSGDKVLALVWSLRLLEAGLMWLLVLAIKPKLKFIFTSLMAAGVIQALWAAWQFLTQSTFANKWLGVAIHPLTQGGTSVVLADGERWLRAYAGQVHPNVLGGLLVITCLATVWLYFNRHREEGGKTDRRGDLWGLFPACRQAGADARNDNYLLLLYIVQLAGLFFTFSRGAWLALFLTLGLWWFKNREQKKYLSRAGIFSIIIFIILGTIYWQPTVGRILGGSRLEQQSIEQRAGSVGESASLLETSWWRGTGIGNYTVGLQQFDPSNPGYRYQPVHNIFLLILTELGIIGLLLFLWIWLTALLRKPFAIYHLLLAAVFVTAMFDHYWWTVPSMFLLLWLIIAHSAVEPLESS
ncbi:MAG: O-antigen ligase family protein [Patescibacteria group bacterium]